MEILTVLKREGVESVESPNDKDDDANDYSIFVSMNHAVPHCGGTPMTFNQMHTEGNLSLPTDVPQLTGSVSTKMFK